MAMAESVAPEAAPSSDYLELLQLVERLHRQLLDVVKDELDREGLDDLNSVQALLLFNIGDQELTAGELRTRGHYLGSNVSYNLKKLVDAGYIRHQRSAVDRRSVRVSLTEGGHAVCSHLNALFERQGTSLAPVGGVEVEQLPAMNTALARIERFWADHIRFRM
ncbi:MAG: DNA-binding MarR family transcriptional regulator [Maricaulis maris]|jgi:DNA-binding MarR family transcriptional regulator|uniref:Transcriptional regulator, MarR family n=1 Tax=Maricaulis maris (strain MCS10) TaxID=394221 RepID=Q0APF4_MARMM|nr:MULTISPECIES: MarR family transcriptional regulator [Maricaulis]ABI65833.1 transcriptional regulator, MarR family [Maricaulis maris MCS10]MAC88150.1 MarR family transcriptional regulator [Maricaulis sp.]